MPVIASSAVFTAPTGVSQGTTGRLGRFGGTTTGPLGETTGLFEDATGKVGINNAAPSAQLTVTASAGTNGVVSDTSSGAGNAVSGTVTSTGTGHGVFGTVTSTGNGNGLVGIVSGSGNGAGVHGSVTGSGNGNGMGGTVSGNGAGNGVSGQVSGTGSGSGVLGLIVGSGIGNGVHGQHSGSGPGTAVTALAAGTGNGSAIHAQVNGNGGGHGLLAQVNGSGNGHGVFAFVGPATTSTGSGDAIYGIAYDGPGTASHGVAVRGIAISASQWAGYFSGNVHATGTLTSSDRRIKSDFQPVTPQLMATLGRLPIQTYVKHLDGRSNDAATGEIIKELRLEVSKIDALAEADRTPEQIAHRAAMLAQIAKFDDEDWLAVKGPQLPGRLAGVIAQDVEAAAPEYVTKAGKPFKDGDDLEPIRTVNDPSILYIMIETLRHDMAKLSAEFAAYRAAHP